MEGSVLSFFKAEWKVSDTGSAHWASSFFVFFCKICIIQHTYWVDITLSYLRIITICIKSECITSNHLAWKIYKILHTYWINTTLSEVVKDHRRVSYLCINLECISSNHLTWKIFIKYCTHTEYILLYSEPCHYITLVHMIFYCLNVKKIVIISCTYKIHIWDKNVIRSFPILSCCVGKGVFETHLPQTIILSLWITAFLVQAWFSSCTAK